MKNALRNLKKCTAAAAIFAVSATPAFAQVFEKNSAENSAAGTQTSGAQNAGTRRIFTLSDDNDFFGSWSDKYYTNHTRFALTLGSDAPATADALRSAWFFSAGQEMYAPKDRKARIPDKKDHPYAGYLYVSAGKTWFDDEFAFSAELQLGTTGEASLADKIQRRYHAIIGETQPRGWDTQIHGRAVAQAIADIRRRAILTGTTAGGNSADAIFRGFAGFGNLRGQLSAGAQFRFGRNLPFDFGYTNLRQSASVVFDPRTEFSFFGWFDIQADVICWDETLTGNNSRGHDIYAYPLAAQASVGFTWVFRTHQVSFFQSVRTKDFSSQDNDTFAYGGFKVSVFF